jgi:hypothetical protein
VGFAGYVTVCVQLYRRFNLGCLHPVARVISYDMGFNPSTRRHSRRLIFLLNLGCLHPVARVISYDVGFNPSTQRHYRRLIYYLHINSYMFRSYDHHQAENYITTLGLLD